MRGSKHRGRNEWGNSTFAYAEGRGFSDKLGHFNHESETLTLNSETTADISRSSEDDVYAITLVAGVTYTITMTSDDLSVPYVILRNASGQSVASDYQSSSETEVSISYTPTETGVYYITSSDLFDQSTGEYTLLVAGDDVNSDDYEASIETTGSVEIDSSITGQLETIGDSDWFAVEMTTDSVYRLELSTQGIELPQLIIRDADGNEIESTYSTSGKKLVIEYTATTDSTIYLDVSDLAGDSIGTYTLSVNSIFNAAVDDYSSNKNTTGSVSVDSTVTGNLETVGDSDWFSIELTEGSVYDFSMTSSDFDSEMLSLYDANGRLVDTSLSSSLTYAADSTATYYVAASQSTEADTGAYIIGVQELII